MTTLAYARDTMVSTLANMLANPNLPEASRQSAQRQLEQVKEITIEKHPYFVWLRYHLRDKWLREGRTLDDHPYGWELAWTCWLLFGGAEDFGRRHAPRRLRVH
jgi:hypothetical protein